MLKSHLIIDHLEDDIELPPLTPNSMLHGINACQPEEDLENLDEETNMSRRARYIKKCKDVMWKRWSSEYVKSLREKHRLLAGKAANVTVGEVMLIRKDEKDRGLWEMGVVRSVITGKDGVVWGVKLKTGKGIIQRPVQHLYPMELKVDGCKVTQDGPKQKELSPEVEEFKPKQHSKAKGMAVDQIKGLAFDSLDDI